jgi:GntR family transcriptional regulator, transcriptional repressor for pyruvate dehydrogenase complex
LSSESATPLPLLRPLGPPRHRAGEVAERLAAEIASGRFPRGSRLPSEQALTIAFGVSRTVLREAVAALRAEGLVETRQGVGAFVARDVQRRPFRIDPAELSSLGEVLNVMELRTGIEIEAAGLAAERASAVARRRIGKALQAIDAALRRGDAAVDEDFAFHQAIAAAAGNPYFSRFLEFLGRFLIPRQSIRIGLRHADDLRTYLERIQKEHRAIYDAIGAGNPGAARDAMRRHLVNGRERYRKLAAEASKSK